MPDRIERFRKVARDGAGNSKRACSGWLQNRGVKVQDKNTYVLSHTTMPATTIECGFIDNAGDNALFDSKQGEIVQGITDAILSIAGSCTESNNAARAADIHQKVIYT